MLRKLVRIAFTAALVLGVVTMHLFGHSEHDGGQQGEIPVTAHTAHQGHTQDAGTLPADDESDPFSLLSLMSFMVCSAIVARFVVELFRSSARPRLWDRLLALAARPGHGTSRPRPPPPHLNPTGLGINRIAVLRI